MWQWRPDSTAAQAAGWLQNELDSKPEPGPRPERDQPDAIIDVTAKSGRASQINFFRVCETAARHRIIDLQRHPCRIMTFWPCQSAHKILLDVVYTVSFPRWRCCRGQCRPTIDERRLLSRADLAVGDVLRMREEPASGERRNMVSKIANGALIGYGRLADERRSKALTKLP